MKTIAHNGAGRNGTAKRSNTYNPPADPVEFCARKVEGTLKPFPNDDLIMNTWNAGGKKKHDIAVGFRDGGLCIFTWGPGPARYRPATLAEASEQLAQMNEAFDSGQSDAADEGNAFPKYYRMVAKGLARLARKFEKR